MSCGPRDPVAARMGGRDQARFVPADEGRALHIPADPYGNAVDFLGFYEPPFGPWERPSMRSSVTALRRCQFIASLATWQNTFDKPLLSQRYRCTRRRASWPLRVSWKLFPGDLKTETFHHPSL